MLLKRFCVTFGAPLLSSKRSPGIIDESGNDLEDALLTSKNLMRLHLEFRGFRASLNELFHSLNVCHQQLLEWPLELEEVEPLQKVLVSEEPQPANGVAEDQQHLNRELEVKDQSSS